MWPFKSKTEPKVESIDPAKEVVERAQRTADRLTGYQRSGQLLHRLVSQAYERGIKEAPLPRKIGMAVITAAVATAGVYAIYVKLHDQRHARSLNLVDDTKEVEVIVGPDGYIVNPPEAVRPAKTNPLDVGEVLAKSLEAAMQPPDEH